MTNKSLSLKLEKLSPQALNLLTEDAVLNSAIFKSVLEQAKKLAEEASKCDELKK
jgi:hypothetical protein